MLSPYVKLHSGCPLCQRLKLGAQDPDFLLDDGHFYIFKSPFGDRWPGALMPIFKKHIFEISDIRAQDIPDTLFSLVGYERTLRKTMPVERINVVKFCNVAHHLHWHIIPRFAEEHFLERNPWELAALSVEELYKPNKRSFSTKALYSEIAKEAHFENYHRDSFFFGCALFLRPAVKELRVTLKQASLFQIMAEARAHPEAWELMLMKRNYFDFAWDFVGGNAEIKEFPQQTMEREVFEELGWKIIESVEVCRQWRRGGVIKGFVYLARPNNVDSWQDSPERIPCDEVQTVAYFNLAKAQADPMFSDSVRGRIRAFVNGQPDFIGLDL